MKTVQTLISQAREKVGTDAELARRLGLTRANVADLKSGARVVSPEVVGSLCALLELPPEEAREWLAVSLIENPKNSSRAEVLRKAFFASSIGALALSLISGRDAEAQTAKCATIQGVEVCPSNGLTGEQQLKKDAEAREAARLKKPECKGARWSTHDNGWTCPDPKRTLEMQRQLEEHRKKSGASFPSFGTLASANKRLYIMSTRLWAGLAHLAERIHYLTRAFDSRDIVAA